MNDKSVWDIHPSVYHQLQSHYNISCASLRIQNQPNVTGHNKRSCMPIFDNYEIFAISKRKKTSFPMIQNFWILNHYTFENIRKRWHLFLIISLDFTSYFAQYLKIRLADIRYLSFVWIMVESEDTWPPLYLFKSVILYTR